VRTAGKLDGPSSRLGGAGYISSSKPHKQKGKTLFIIWDKIKERTKKKRKGLQNVAITCRYCFFILCGGLTIKKKGLDARNDDAGGGGG